MSRQPRSAPRPDLRLAARPPRDAEPGAAPSPVPWPISPNRGKPADRCCVHPRPRLAPGCEARRRTSGPYTLRPPGCAARAPVPSVAAAGAAPAPRSSASALAYSDDPIAELAAGVLALASTPRAAAIPRLAKTVAPRFPISGALAPASDRRQGLWRWRTAPPVSWPGPGSQWLLIRLGIP